MYFFIFSYPSSKFFLIKNLEWGKQFSNNVVRVFTFKICKRDEQISK